MSLVKLLNAVLKVNSRTALSVWVIHPRDHGADCQLRLAAPPCFRRVSYNVSVAQEET